MTHEPQDFARCAGKSLTLDMQMGKAPIPETYKCGTCLRHYTNSPSHPAEKTNCAWFDPWPDFTPCGNFAPLKWSDPISDEEINQMLLDEMPSLPQRLRQPVTEYGAAGFAVKQLRIQQGWTVDKDGKDVFDNAVKVRRVLLADAIDHEYKRRTHAG